MLPHKASQDYSIKLQMLSIIRFLACPYCMGRELLQKKTILSSENTLHNFHTHNLLLKKWNIKISLQVLAILEILFTLQKSPDLIYEEKFLI